MRQFLIRRILQLVPTLFGISVFIFLIISAAPGNPMSNLIDPNLSKEAFQRRAEQLGVDKPVHVQYITWLRHTLSGNLGYSIRFKKPVTEIIKSRLFPTFLLSFASLFFSFIIAVPIGVLSATKQYSRMDYLFTILAMAGVSIPVFFLGIAMIKIFAFDFGWFPINNMVTPGLEHANWLERAKDIGHHLVLPLFVLSAASIASWLRYVRSSMLEVIRQDYIRTARAKGLSERVVIYKHALRNALLPVITILGLSLPYVFSGAIITETVFTWPGMGTLNIQAVISRDYPLLMGINLFLAVMVLLGNLLADIFYGLVDPRIRYD